MTGQSLLDRMELLDAELQLQVGEADVTKGLLALNVAQDYFESLAAQRGHLGGQTGTVVTVANTETTAFPSGVLRIDRLQMLDAVTSRPKRDLTPLRRTGGHAANFGWFYNLVGQGNGGEVGGYWTNGLNIYWSPLPADVYTIRWYGFQRQSDITASGTFAYEDMVALPLASFATRLVKSGLDDNASDLSALALETFSQALDALGNLNRDGATGLAYTRIHRE